MYLLWCVFSIASYNQIASIKCIKIAYILLRIFLINYRNAFYALIVYTVNAVIDNDSHL